MAKRFRWILAAAALSATSPLCAATLPDAAPRVATAAELMRGAESPPHAATPFDTAIAEYQPGAWTLPSLDPRSFLNGFLKGAGLLALLCLISQRRLILRGRARRD